jgi:hypothetical protein
MIVKLNYIIMSLFKQNDVKNNELKYTDLTIMFDNNKILKVHRYILACDSVYFLNLFEQYGDELKVIDLTNKSLMYINDYETTAAYLNILYNGELYLNETNIVQLFDLNEYIESNKLTDIFKQKKFNNTCKYILLNQLFEYNFKLIKYIKLIEDYINKNDISFICEYVNIFTDDLLLYLIEKFRELIDIKNLNIMIMNEKISNNKKYILAFYLFKYKMGIFKLPSNLCASINIKINLDVILKYFRHDPNIIAITQYIITHNNNIK